VTRLPDKHPRVLALCLSALLDYQPGPATDRRNPLSVRQPASTGFAASKWIDCRTCAATGKTKRGNHTTKCRSCKGDGGWAVDPYDNNGKPVELGTSLTTAQGWRQVCSMTERELVAFTQVAVAGGDTSLDPDPLWRQLQLQTRRRTGTAWARHLEGALLALEPFDRLLLGWCYTIGVQPPATLPWYLRHRLVQAMLRLRDALPAGFTAPRWAKDKATTELAAERALRQARNFRSNGERDDAIRSLAGRGMNASTIERKLGVSRRTIGRVLEEREAA
jgi:hypothetical protein